MNQLSRAIYIHIPFCKSRCYYCAFLSSCDYSREDDYVSSLCREMTFYADDNFLISSIFVGGGTPSTLRADNIKTIFDTIRANFTLAQDCEISVECNPESVDEQFCAALYYCGVNRVSIGLQSCSDDTLRSIGRLHSYADFCRAINLLTDVGIDNINADIIVGLPESREVFVDTVCKIVDTKHINHISMYALELYDDSVLRTNIVQGLCRNVAESDEQADWYDIAYDIMSEHGYSRYEVSNFSKQGYQCKHNINYWRCGEYYGFGAGAASYIDNIRKTNCADINMYMNDFGCSLYYEQETISEVDSMYEYIMLGLRLDRGIGISEFAAKFRCDIFRQYPMITQLISQGYLELSDGRVFVPERHTYVLNSILVQILE